MAVLDGPRTLLPFAQIGNWKFLIDGFALYRANPSIRNWHHEKYHLLSLKIRERVGPKSALIS